MLRYKSLPNPTEIFILQWSLSEMKPERTTEEENELLSPKRRVRFADLLGQSLVSVKFISPVNSDVDLPAMKLPSRPRNGTVNPRLHCCFPQPAAITDNLEGRVKDQNVCLENVVLSTFAIVGTVIVKNLAFAKEVSVRYTLNDWRSYQDVWADYVAFSSSLSCTDRFQFRINVPPEFAGGIEFAVRYRVAGSEFWDNNTRLNYRIECLESNSAP